jgi:hypothetical protein
MIMTAYPGKGPYQGPLAVGVATSVQLNTPEEMSAIAKSVNADGHAEAMWRLPSIQKRFPSFFAFETFWKKESCEYIPWRCPAGQYEWFKTPVPLNSAELFPPTIQGGKPPEIVKMFSSYMVIRPDQALTIVRNSLNKDSAIIKWLMSGTFEGVAKRTESYGSPTPSGGPKNHDSAPP